jgi:hypothetical protein
MGMRDRWKRVKQNSNVTGLCRIEEHKKNGMVIEQCNVVKEE